MATGGAYAGAPEVPNFGRVGYVAASADSVALVKTKSGAFKMKVTDESLATVPRWRSPRPSSTRASCSRT